MPSFDFDPSEYIDEIDDYYFVEEFVHRWTIPGFKARALKAIKELADEETAVKVMAVSADEFERARYEFERGSYEDMMIHLERALGWKGLDKLRVTK